MVTPVQNQEQCNSGWAFAAAGALESAEAINGGALFSFSTQQLIDCDYKNQGCKGGSPEDAFKYYKNGALAMHEDTY